MSNPTQNKRQIPSIDSLLKAAEVETLVEQYGRDLVTESLRNAAARLREADNQQSTAEQVDSRFWLISEASRWLEDLLTPSLKPVFNLTGTVLHTNLGRAPMPQECIDAVVAVSQGASNLEFRLSTGKRGDRDEHVERWLCRLTGAEAATVVNNNAAAVLLTLNSLASRKSVAVSRGELIEIGGSFRMPDIMKRAGCKLYEVGTTNRTHLKDYAEAVDDGAVAVMRVHTSNYVVEGFTAEVDDREMGKLAHDNGAYFINDLGSGALIDMTRFGLPPEATPRDAIDDGADVVTFSGDKLLGGPQCGLIVGSKKTIDRIKKNPMKRAMRCDKMTLAALEATLRLYANPEALVEKVPGLRLLTRTESEIEKTANEVMNAMTEALGKRCDVELRPCQSQIGSGALPIDKLASHAIVLTPHQKSGRALSTLGHAFRQLPIPVVGRINDGALWFDLRCLENGKEFVANLTSLELK